MRLAHHLRTERHILHRHERHGDGGCEQHGTWKVEHGIAGRTGQERLARLIARPERCGAGAGERDDRVRQGRNSRVACLCRLAVNKGGTVVADGHGLGLGEGGLGPLADPARAFVDEIALIPAVLPARDGVADGSGVGDRALQFLDKRIVGTPEQLNAGALDAIEQCLERGLAASI